MLRLSMAQGLNGAVRERASRWPNFTSRADKERLFALRARSDLVFTSAKTLRQEGILPPLFHPTPSRPAWAVLSLKGDFPSFLLEAPPPRPPLFLVCPHQPLQELCQPNQRWVPLTQKPDGSPRLEELLQYFQHHGFSQFLLESGPTLSSFFFDQDLVDEIHLTLSPKIFASDDPLGLCPFLTRSQPLHFTLIGCETIHHETHLTFSRNRKEPLNSSD
jgi:riboflavin biosynthesis pyrimidine reductase